VLGPSDYIYTEPGEERFLEAIDDSVIFASTPKPVVVTGNPRTVAEKT
jgi:hypothetical protein